MKYTTLFVFALVSISMANPAMKKFLGKQCGDPDMEMATTRPPVDVTPCRAELCLKDKFQDCVMLEEGDYSMGALAKAGIPNDQVESVRVHGGPHCVASLFQHADKAGWQVHLTNGEYTCADLQKAGGKCNDLSYAIVFRDTPPAPVTVQPVTVQPVETACMAELCLKDNFGDCVMLKEGDYNMGALATAGIPNDQVESIRVHGHPYCTVSVFQHADKAGWQVHLTEGEYTCADIKKAGGKCNDLSYAIVHRDTPAPAATPCELSLCQGNDFTKCVTVGEGDWPMNNLISKGMPNDSTQSIKTSGQPGCTYELHQHSQFSGWKVMIMEEGDFTCADLVKMGGKCKDLSSAKVYRN